MDDLGSERRWGRGAAAVRGYACAMDWRAATGLASGALAFAATIPYIRATARGTIRPNSVTWAGWWLLSSIVFAAQMLSEPSWSAAVPASSALYCGIVVVLTVRTGGTRLGALDVVCGLLGLAAIVAWQVTADARAALVIAIAGDVVLCVPTFAKTLRDPRSELGSRYLFASATNALGAISAARLDFLSLGWPVYLIVCNAAIGLLALRAPRQGADQLVSAAASESPAPAVRCAGSARARGCWR